MTSYWGSDDLVRYADAASKPGRLQQIIANTHKVLDARLEGNERRALIVSDTEVSPHLYHTMAGALSSRGVEPTIALVQQPSMPNQEPPAEIAEAARSTDVVVNMCVYTITHTEAIEEARAEGVSYVLLADPTEDMFSRGLVDGDPDELDTFTKRVASVLHRGDQVRVTSPQGTDVELSVTGREQVAVQYPLGETPACPIEESVDGKIVHDSFMMGVGLLDEPITWEVENGRIVDIAGGREATRLREILETHGDENARWIGEFSVMTHPHARPNGSYIEHKQVRGGVHFALGDGTVTGGQYASSIHLDGVQLEPTVTVDGEVLVDRGEFDESLLPPEERIADDIIPV